MREINRCLGGQWICGIGILLFMMLLLTAGGCVEEPSFYWSLESGDKVPEFETVTLTGVRLNNKSFSNQKGYIIFFSTYCGDCRRELPMIENSYRDYFKSNEKENIEVICISRENNREEVMRFVEEFDLTMPVAVANGELIYQKFASGGVPRVYAIEAGVITAVYLEEIPRLFDQ